MATMMYPTPQEATNSATPPGWVVRRLPDDTHVLRRTVAGRLCADGWPLFAIVLLLLGMGAVVGGKHVGTPGEKTGLLAVFVAVATGGVALRVWMTRTEVVARARRLEVWRGWPGMRCVYDVEGDHTELRIGTTWSLVGDNEAPQQQVERELTVSQVGNGFERIVGLTRHTTPERWSAEGGAADDEAALLGLYLSRVTGWPLTGLPLAHGEGT